MPHQVIMFNGPPASGKDTAGLFVLEEYNNVRIVKFADPLKQAVAAMFGLSFETVRRLEAIGSQDKDKPMDELMGFSWRQALIWMSEQCMKPKFGKDIFGALMAQRLSGPTSCELTVITDCGFTDEVLPVIDEMGPANCHIIRLHREDCTFDGDSRSHLFMNARKPPPVGTRVHDLRNNHDKKMFRIQVLRRVDAIMGRKREFQLV
jgi:hypothetical protein